MRSSKHGCREMRRIYGRATNKGKDAPKNERIVGVEKDTVYQPFHCCGNLSRHLSTTQPMQLLTSPLAFLHNNGGEEAGGPTL